MSPFIWLVGRSILMTEDILTTWQVKFHHSIPLPSRRAVFVFIHIITFFFSSPLRTLSSCLAWCFVGNQGIHVQLQSVKVPPKKDWTRKRCIFSLWATPTPRLVKILRNCVIPRVMTDRRDLVFQGTLLCAVHWSKWRSIIRTKHWAANARSILAESSGYRSHHGKKCVFFLWQLW